MARWQQERDFDIAQTIASQFVASKASVPMFTMQIDVQRNSTWSHLAPPASVLHHPNDRYENNLPVSASTPSDNQHFKLVR